MSDLTILVSLGNIAIRTLTQTQLAAQINAIMGDLGDQEVKNAKRALQDALRSSDPRHELISAVNHFQSAASNFTADSSHGKAAECYAAIATIYASLGEHQNKLSYAADFSNAVFAQLTVDMEYVRENLGLKSTGIWGMLGNIGKYGGNYESGRLGSYQSRPDPKELARSALADITSDKKKAKAFLDTLKAPVGRLNQIPERIDQVR